jgi:hypothetical protein
MDLPARLPRQKSDDALQQGERAVGSQRPHLEANAP